MTQHKCQKLQFSGGVSGERSPQGAFQRSLCSESWHDLSGATGGADHETLRLCGLPHRFAHGASSGRWEFLNGDKEVAPKKSKYDLVIFGLGGRG